MGLTRGHRWLVTDLGGSDTRVWHSAGRKADDPLATGRNRRGLLTENMGNTTKPNRPRGVKTKKRDED